MKWKFYAGKDITATPAIYGGALYFPSWNGYIYAVKEADGSLIWMKNLLMLTGLNATDGVVPNVNSTVSRSTPTVAGDLLIFGTYSPAAIIALKIKTGELVWKITLDDHPEALITMSGTYYNGSVLHAHLRNHFVFFLKIQLQINLSLKFSYKLVIFKDYFDFFY